MVEGKHKSRSVRRVKTRTPKGKVVTHFTARKPGKAQCSQCGDYLKGTPHVAAAKLRTLSLSQKRPSRPYGGVLCSPCSRQLIVDKVRNIFSLSKK